MWKSGWCWHAAREQRKRRGAQKAKTLQKIHLSNLIFPMDIFHGKNSFTSSFRSRHYHFPHLWMKSTAATTSGFSPFCPVWWTDNDRRADFSITSVFFFIIHSITWKLCSFMLNKACGRCIWPSWRIIANNNWAESEIRVTSITATAVTNFIIRFPFSWAGGGQRPFEQCSKKLHYWCGMASLMGQDKFNQQWTMSFGGTIAIEYFKYWHS